MECSSIHIFYMVYNLEKKTDRLRVYNFSRVGPDREWLQDLLLKDDSSESTSDESVTEEEIRREMKLHFLRKKYRKRFYTSNEVISNSYFFEIVCWKFGY